VLDESTNPDYEFRYIDISAVGRGSLVAAPSAVRFSEAPSRARRLVRSGDTIVSTVRTYLRAVWSVDGDVDDLVVSTGFAVLSPRPPLDRRFFAYVVESDPFIEEVVGRSVGVSYPAVNPSEVGDIAVPVPAMKEQRAIADFLDRETARIDALITAKRRMIDALDARLSALRKNLVLAGVDPFSGGGQARNGCSTANLGTIVALQRGHDLPFELRREGPIPVVSSGGVSGQHDTAACNPPGVVTGRYGTIGEVFFVDVPYWPLNTTLYVQDFRGNDPRWVLHLLRALPLDFDAEKSAVTGINRNVIGYLRVPVPPLAEQREIAASIDELAGHTSEVVTRLTRQIELLVEHRQALITAAVNGELSVPGVAA